jgi:hypothetical protein
MSNPTIVNRYVHPHGAPAKGKILMVASSPAISGQTGWPIGFWAAELTHPLHVFQEAGYEVELASTAGGALQMDSFSDPTDASGYSAHDVISLGYMQQPQFRAMLANTRKFTDVTARRLRCHLSRWRAGSDVHLSRQRRTGETVRQLLRSGQAGGSRLPFDHAAARGEEARRRTPRDGQDVDRFRRRRGRVRRQRCGHEDSALPHRRKCAQAAQYALSRWPRPSLPLPSPTAT